MRILVETVVVEPPDQTAKDLDFVVFERLEEVTNHLLVSRPAAGHRTLHKNHLRTTPSTIFIKKSKISKQPYFGFLVYLEIEYTVNYGIFGHFLSHDFLKNVQKFDARLKKKCPIQIA